MEEYLESRDANWDRYQIAQAYMALGGTPFYLSLLDTTKSLAQNIDELYFAPNGALRIEFNELYNALFSNADKNIGIVRSLAEHRSGLSRTDLSKATGLQGSTLTRVLTNLEKSNFIIKDAQFGKTVRNAIYRLCDFYTLFFFQFVEKNLSKDRHWWTHNMNTPAVMAWQGFSFEMLCLLHLDQIITALGISGISTSASEWRNESAQIDLIIDRADRLINLCEIKFSVDTYEITKEYADRIRQRRAEFQSATNTRKGLVTTFITTYGVRQGKHSSIAQAEVTLEQLFC